MSKSTTAAQSGNYPKGTRGRRSTLVRASDRWLDAQVTRVRHELHILEMEQTRRQIDEAILHAWRSGDPRGQSLAEDALAEIESGVGL